MDELGCVAEPLAIAHLTYEVVALGAIIFSFAMFTNLASTAVFALLFYSPILT